MIPVKIPVVSSERHCGGCTKCCEGWLWGDAHGHKFWPGRPCHFSSSKGCSIYHNRPDVPCKSFECEWLKNDNIPEWMKPDISNVVITKSIENDREFLQFMEVGARLDPRILSWIFMNYVDNKLTNVKYLYNGELSGKEQ